MNKQDYICEKHSIRLLFTLKGGAGFCRRCSMYTQGILANAAKKVTKPERRKQQKKAA
ncbi:MAG: hypothetical protein L0226_15065 [Acidobacteria bacterium]|nr:hypothetical protein [Acidobacteriota bacterium]